MSRKWFVIEEINLQGRFGPDSNTDFRHREIEVHCQVPGKDHEEGKVLPVPREQAGWPGGLRV